MIGRKIDFGFFECEGSWWGNIYCLKDVSSFIL